MADFTKTITNSLRLFSEGPSTKWGDANGFPYTMVWGTSKWGEGESLPIAFVKVISNTQSLAWDPSSKAFTKIFEIGSLVASADLSSEELMQGPWNIIFTSNTEEGESRDLATWTQISNPDATFTCQAAGATSWSEV